MSAKVTYACDICGNVFASDFDQRKQFDHYVLVSFSVTKGENSRRKALCEGEICDDCAGRIAEAVENAVAGVTGGSCKPPDPKELLSRFDTLDVCGSGRRLA